MDKLSFIDVETTGLSPTHDRIIEIGIVRVENGTVVKTFESLINPNMYIHPMIQTITGINFEDLVNAPTFEELSDEIGRLLTDATFVAHNVRFDYSFIRSEFKRIDQPFRAPQLCTARLSRRLFPRFKHHGLTHIIERFKLECPRRHRAFDDAHALWQFYQVITTTVSPETFAAAQKSIQKRPTLPALLTGSIQFLPETPGVYFFYDNNNTLLYIGKAKNIKSRVLSHFSNDGSSAKELSMCRQIARIEHVKTAGELGALLREAYFIKTMKPIYNRVLRYKKTLVVIYEDEIDGYKTARIETMSLVDAHQLEHIIGVFKSKKQALEKLSEIALTHKLCKKLLGIEHTKSSCFGSHLGTCKGACTGKEPPLRYNLRFLLARAENRLKPWLFKSSVTIQEKNQEEELYEQFTIDQWCLLKHMGTDMTTSLPTGYTLDLDTYNILRNYLKANYLAGKNNSMITISA